MNDGCVLYGVNDPSASPKIPHIFFCTNIYPLFTKKYVHEAASWDKLTPYIFRGSH